MLKFGTPIVFGGGVDALLTRLHDEKFTLLLGDQGQEHRFRLGRDHLGNDREEVGVGGQHWNTFLVDTFVPLLLNTSSAAFFATTGPLLRPHTIATLLTPILSTAYLVMLPTSEGRARRSFEGPLAAHVMASKTAVAGRGAGIFSSFATGPTATPRNSEGGAENHGRPCHGP